MRFVLLGMGFLLFGIAGGAHAEEQRPNIVFILADDLGWADLGCQGSDYYETPHIDRLAAEGMRFTRYYASPNCVPSRAALMSGHYAPRTGMYTVGDSERGRAEDRKLAVPVNVEALPLGLKTIADVLRGAGYATGMFGKWHLGTEDAYHPSKRGFDEAISSQGKHFNFVTRPLVEHGAEAYHGDFMTDRAVDFIARRKGEPFFLYLPHFLVHKPIEPKPALAARWKEKPATGIHSNADYAAMIESLDESVGRVMAALETAGIADKTLLIFTSDNGGLGSYDHTEPPSETKVVTDNHPLGGGKGTLREGGVRVPFIARWPGRVSPGSVCNTPIAHVDMLPSFAAMAGAALPEQPLDGVDIAPLLAGQTSEFPKRAIYLHFPVYLESYVHERGWRTTPGSFVVEDDWKLIEYFETGQVELYNLAEDVAEAKNLAEAHPELAARLKSQLTSWRSEIGAAIPTMK